MSTSSHSESSSTADEHGLDYVEVAPVEPPHDNATAEGERNTFVKVTTVDGVTVTYTHRQVREAELKAQIRELLDR